MPRPENSTSIGPAANTRSRQTSTPQHRETIAQIVSTMADDAIKPPLFKGLTSEDAHRWLDKLNGYVLATKKDNEQKKGIFGLLLDDGASDWYDSLPIAEKESYETMSAAFTQRYIAKQNNWQESTALFQQKQRPEENILDFISNIRRQALRANIPEQQAMNAILSGMHDHSRPFILQHNPVTITDIIKHARTLENAQGKTQGKQQNSPAQSNENTTQLAMAVNAITDLTKNLSELMKGHQQTVYALQEMSHSRHNDYQHHGSSERSNRSRSPYNNGNHQRTGRSPSPYPRGQQPSRGRSQSPYSNKQSQNQGKRVNWKQGDDNRKQNYGKCRSCGEYHNRSTCQFRNAICHQCQRQGHIQKVCFSGKGY